LRNFSSRPVPSSWQGEIKGKAAAGGKIGGGIIFEGAIDVGVQRAKLTLPQQTPIDKPSDADFKKFAMMFKELSGSKEKVETLTIEEVKDIIEELKKNPPRKTARKKKAS
jgi:hypothetical protein